MTKSEQACAYLESMARKSGGDVKVFQNAQGKFVMHKKGEPQRAAQVSLEEPRERFVATVKWLMEG